jgi:hypothetical protein
MPIPQVNDRIKEAPAVMLRAVFAGVGQLLLAADKVRARAAGTGWPYDRPAPKGQGRAQARWHTLDEGRSGTVPLARERATSHYPPAHPPAGGPGGATAAPAAAAQRPAPVAAAKPAPPLDGYDDLSLPSLRARLRGFDAAKLRALLAYEKAHANRDDVITLFERRLAKITAA